MEYLLTVRLPFNAIDDVEGRAKAREHLDDLGINFAQETRLEVKLQELPKGQVPRKVEV